MSNQELAYLKEMGIQSYQLAHPERLQGYVSKGIELPSSCALLIVSPLCPEGKSATLLANILKTMDLTLEQVRHLAPQDLPLLTQNHLTWVWFSGCEVQSGIAERTLHSPLLNELDGNQAEKRALWQKIQALK